MGDARESSGARPDGEAAAARDRGPAADRAMRQPAMEPARLLEMIGDAFVAFDENLVYTYVNARAEEILGRRAADLLGRCYWDEWPEARGTPFADAYERALRTRLPIHM